MQGEGSVYNETCWKLSGMVINLYQLNPQEEHGCMAKICFQEKLKNYVSTSRTDVSILSKIQLTFFHLNLVFIESFRLR